MGRQCHSGKHRCLIDAGAGKVGDVAQAKMVDTVAGSGDVLRYVVRYAVICGQHTSLREIVLW
jgi:hypothetical protein